MRPATPAVRASALPAGPLVLALACALALSGGCARSPAPGAPAAHEAVLVRGGGPDPDSLDPQKARGFEAQSMLRDLCEGLTTLDRQAAVAPGVATRWSASADGLTWRFELRPTARWSNGDPVTAADFVAALRRLVDPATGSGYAQYVDVIANASDIVAGRKPRMPSAWPPPMRRRSSSASPPPPRTCRRCCRTQAPARCTGRRSPHTRTGSRGPASCSPTGRSC